MSKRFAALLLSLILLAPTLRAADPAPKSPYTIKLAIDHQDGVYKTGEPVVFTISVLKDGQPAKGAEALCEVTRYRGIPVSSEKLPLAGEPLTVKATLDAPGFLRCKVSCPAGEKDAATAEIGAAVAPLEIKPSLPPPDDFDAFWADQKKKLAASKMEPTLTPIDSPTKGVECFDLQIPCPGGRPVSAYFARPAAAKPKSLPAVLYTHGAGYRTSSLPNAAYGAEQGMLSVDLNALGAPNGKPDQFYADLATGELKNYPAIGIESRDTYFFLGMYLRLLRALDFLAAQPEWDGRNLFVSGSSQGGGQAIVAAGLDPRVTAIAASVPAMCDLTGPAAGRPAGWPNKVPLITGKMDPKLSEVARYFDAMNFAPRAKADAVFIVGLIDNTCPASSVYAAFNACAGKKEMVVRPAMGHQFPSENFALMRKFLKDHIRKD